ncbi:ChrR family anti-sigma-E factor [Parendozoicomonas haliclonae]|uniref:Anti-sigma-E factor ChrR n=1 Tax=Parendozoicomonas haliclonae TaxID=1960125 RepID=A0A1X7AJ48_9GAMM|nr:ChrR family anti-sigma-E factor [Parendozoicomonas haliclonae]SMA40284.1 Anti-sigma-E factor ChrR [Parendozoicomonas haliclonae]
MKPQHHPDSSSLMSYAAGSLPDSIATVIACHVSTCEQCQRNVAEAEQLGRFLMESSLPEQSEEESQHIDLAPNARDDILALIDSDEYVEPQVVVESDVQEAPSDVPLPLQPLLGKSLDNLLWKSMAPGLKQFVLPATSGTLRLLRIAPGTSMPIHSHTGSEVTLVLRGSYYDEMGRFGAGDVADLDPEVEHQPATATGEDCICLIATDAPLKFSGLVPRLLQPFFQL